MPLLAHQPTEARSSSVPRSRRGLGAIAAVGMLAWLYSRYVFLVIAVAYVSHGIIFYLVGLLRPSRNKTEVYEEFDH